MHVSPLPLGTTLSINLSETKLLSYAVSLRSQSIKSMPATLSQLSYTLNLSLSLSLSPLETIELAEKRGNITTADLFISSAYNPTHMCTELQLHLHLYLYLFLFLYPYLYLPCCFCICDVWPCSLLILATFCCGFYSCLAAHKNCMCPSASGARDCTARGQKRECAGQGMLHKSEKCQAISKSRLHSTWARNKNVNVGGGGGGGCQFLFDSIKCCPASCLYIFLMWFTATRQTISDLQFCWGFARQQQQQHTHTEKILTQRKTLHEGS